MIQNQISPDFRFPEADISAKEETSGTNHTSFVVHFLVTVKRKAGQVHPVLQQLPNKCL